MYKCKYVVRFRNAIYARQAGYTTPVWIYCMYGLGARLRCLALRGPCPMQTMWTFCLHISHGYTSQFIWTTKKEIDVLLPYEELTTLKNFRLPWVPTFAALRYSLGFLQKRCNKKGKWHGGQSLRCMAVCY